MATIAEQFRLQMTSAATDNATLTPVDMTKISWEGMEKVRLNCWLKLRVSYTLCVRFKQT